MPNADTQSDGQPPDPDEEVDQLDRMLGATAVKLAEHCDSVRIIATMHQSDGQSLMLARGAGNWFAQRDSVREWLMKQDQSSRNEAL